MDKSYLNRVRKMEEIPEPMLKAVSVVKYQERVASLKKKGAVPFVEKGFEKIGYDTYKRTEEPDAGSIWQITTIKDANGNEERWLVVYTDENDTIIRQVKASIKNGTIKPSEVKRLIKDNVSVDRVAFRKDGIVVFKRSYFYRHGQTSEAFMNKIISELQNLGLTVISSENEDHWNAWPRDSWFEARIKVKELEPLKEPMEVTVEPPVEKLPEEMTEPQEGISEEPEKTSSKKISYTPGTIVQVNVPYGHLYEKYNGKVGEVRSAVPDRSQVIFKDIPSMWFEDNTIKTVASCNVCNKEVSLQGLKTVGKIQCKCKASYNRNQLEKIAYIKRVNEKASLKKKAQIGDVWELESAKEKEAIDVLNSLIEQAFSGDENVQKFLEEVFEEKWDSTKKKLETEGSVWYVWYMDGVHKFMSMPREGEEEKIAKKAQNVIMWFDNPKALKYLKELNTPSSPAEESLEKPATENVEEVEEETEPSEEVEKEAKTKNLVKKGEKIYPYTKLSDETCEEILDMVQSEFGEIGEFLIEGKEVGFEVYRGPFEDAPKLITSDGITLKLTDKFEEGPAFALAYEISVEETETEPETEVGEKEASKKKTADRLVYEVNPSYWDVDELIKDLRELGVKFDVEYHGSLRTDLLPETERDYFRIHIALHESGKNYEKTSSKKFSVKKAEHDNLIKSFTADEAKCIGDSLGVDWTFVDLTEFTMGMQVEREHSGVVGEGNAVNYAKIALDHLNELPDYYTRLHKMESEDEGIEKEVPLEAINEKIESNIKEATIKTADGMEALRGGGAGGSSSKLEPMGWNVKETGHPKLPGEPKKLDIEEEEPEEEELEEITITLNPETKDFSVDFGNQEGVTEEKEKEPQGAEAPPEQPIKSEEEKTEEVVEEEETDLESSEVF